MHFSMRHAWFRLVLIVFSIYPAACCRVTIDNFPEVDRGSGSDLVTYVTQPDIRVPIWNVTKHVPNAISPGYYFVAPYTDLEKIADRLEYRPCEVGPSIYDGDGNLVWTGACLPQNRDRNVLDFRPYMVNGETRFSYITTWDLNQTASDRKGYATMYDGSYKELGRVQAREQAPIFNVHEFNVIENGNKALFLEVSFQAKSIYGNPSSTELTAGSDYYMDEGAFEIDLTTHNIDYEWWARGSGITADESYHQNHGDEQFWDYLHFNSVDKLPSGGYILSSRHASTIFITSPTFAKPLMRLGGHKSDFMLDFDFSSQHNVKVVSDNDTTLVISFFDNASDDCGRQPDTSAFSSTKLVAVYKSQVPMTAKLIQQWNHPHSKLTRSRGGATVDSKTHSALTCWVRGGLITEHSSDGRLLFEGSFLSPRFSTYRAYKSTTWVGRPTEPPILKSFYYRTDDTENNSDPQHLIVSYVSWNGATEVKNWAFYGATNAEPWKFVPIGHKAKQGFETTFTSTGLWSHIKVEGLAADGNVIGQSQVEFVTGFTDMAKLVGSPASSPPYLAPRSKTLVMFVLCQLVVLFAFIIRKRRTPRWRWPLRHPCPDWSEREEDMYLPAPLAKTF